jgi:hypothetical protein
LEIVVKEFFISFLTNRENMERFRRLAGIVDP